MERHRIEHLLSVVHAERRTLGETNARTVLASLAQDPSAHDLTHEELGEAHLALFPTDGRHLMSAMQHFIDAEREDRLSDLLSLARRYGHIRGVYELRAHGRKAGCAKLLVPDFITWFTDWGVSRFDVYHDLDTQLCFIHPDDVALITRIVSDEVSDPETFWSDVLGRLKADPNYPAERYALLTKLATETEPVVAMEPRREQVDVRIRRYCSENDLDVLQQLQTGRDDLQACSSVFLVLDRADGIVKILKELPAARFDRLGSQQDEGELYAHTDGINGLARCYGRTVIDETLTCLRLGVCYGQSFADFVEPGNQLTVDEACLVVGRIAEILAQLHRRGLLYLDLRPHNVKVDGRDVHLLDLGDSHRLAPEATTVSTHTHDVRYTAPEVVTKGCAGAATDLFQLGVLFHELVTGEHPFTVAAQADDETDEERHLRYALSIGYQQPSITNERDTRLGWISRLLARDPRERPSADTVAQALLDGSQALHLHHRRRSPPEKTHGTILFPARLGIPHRGHIDFMSRLLELGYELVVPIEMSYTRSADDPLPKWIVRKMIARSLERRGFDPSRVRLSCVPLFDTDERYRLHYALMPGAEEVVAVASGNPDVHRMFGDRFPIIDQSMLFAEEGEMYEVRSWGARLRHALRVDDRDTFRDLIADGAEDVLSYDEMRAACLDTGTLLFVWGHENWGSILVTLRDERDNLIAQRRISVYNCPEETLLQALKGASWVDPFARESELLWQGTSRRLRYEGIVLDEEQNAVLSYYLLSDPIIDTAS